MLMKFSIIIPVYNAEPFLLKCLDSIFNQKFNYAFEVIAINDASTDDSLSIINNYAKNEERLIILDQLSNTGQAIARGNGMKIAQGDYIMHVDADDWILENAFEEIYKKIQKYNPDVLILNTYVQNQGKEKVLREYFNFEGFVKKEDLGSYEIQAAFYQHSGTKVVRRGVANGLIVSSDEFETTAEDFLYCFEVFLKSKTIYLFRNAYYVINVHDNSLTQRTESYKKMNNQIVLLNLLKTLLIKYKPIDLIINNLLIYREKACVNLALNCWLEGTGEKIEGSKIIEAYQLFPEMEGKRIRSIEKSLKKKLGALYFSFKFQGFYSTIVYILKFKTLKLVKK